MTRKNKKDFFFFTQNESKQFLLALGGVWTKLKPSPENITKNFTHHKIYTPRPKVCAENPPDWRFTDKYTRFSGEGFTYPPFKCKMNVLIKAN